MGARAAIVAAAHAYARAVDIPDFAKAVEIFREDGIFDMPGQGEVRGREAISAIMQERELRRRAGVDGCFQRHNITTSVVELDGPSAALATHYVLVVTELGLDHMGRYEDRLAKTSDAWRVAHRRVSVEWIRPDSRFLKGFSGPSLGARQ
jgi:hypothetical protein